MAAGDEYPRAFLGKMLGDAETDAGAAAGNDSDFACELAGHAIPFRLRHELPPCLTLIVEPTLTPAC